MVPIVSRHMQALKTRQSTIEHKAIKDDNWMDVKLEAVHKQSERRIQSQRNRHALWEANRSRARLDHVA